MVRTYRLRYGNAAEVAKMLANIFGGQQSGAGDSPANQITPGSNTRETRLDSLGTGARNGGSAGQSGVATRSSRGATPIAAALDALSPQKETDATGTHH